MPSYKKMKVCELRELCESRGIDHVGLKKSRLIEALHDFDNAPSASVGEEMGGPSDRESEEEEEEEIEFANDGGGGDCANGRDVVSPSLSEGRGPAEHEDMGHWRYQLEVEKLKLQAAREAREAEREAREAEREARERNWEIERERLTLLGQTDPRSQSFS